MHSRERLPSIASCLPSSQHRQAEAEAGVGGEKAGDAGGEQVQQEQLMHGALFQVILQQLGELLLQTEPQLLLRTASANWRGTPQW